VLLSLESEWPLVPAEAEELLVPAAEVMAGMVEFEAEEALYHDQYGLLRGRALPRLQHTHRRGCLATRGDRSAVKGHVTIESSTLVAAVLVRVARALLVAVLQADLVRRFFVGAPTFLVLQDRVGEFALAEVVASAQRLVDVGT